MTEQTPGQRRRMLLVMSFSTTQKAILNGLGQLAIMSPSSQASYQIELQQRLQAAEEGKPWPPDRWVLDVKP